MDLSKIDAQDRRNYSFNINLKNIRYVLDLDIPGKKKKKSLIEYENECRKKNPENVGKKKFHKYIKSKFDSFNANESDSNTNC